MTKKQENSLIHNIVNRDTDFKMYWSVYSTTDIGWIVKSSFLQKNKSEDMIDGQLANNLKCDGSEKCLEL